MTDSSIQTRLEALENEVRELKMVKKNTDSSLETKKLKKDKEKKTREPTKYNIFVSEYINEQKEKLGTEFNHKVAFKEAAVKWKESKEALVTKEVTETN